MQTISSNIAKQTFGHILETAQREPVLIQKHNHPAAVIVSVAEYDRLKSRPHSSAGAATDDSSVNIATGVGKSLPSIEKRRGKSRKRLTSEEMIELVKAAEFEDDA